MRRVQPTGRGAAITVAALVLGALGALTGLQAALVLAGTLGALVVVCLVMAALSLVGLDAVRTVGATAVPAPGQVAVQAEAAGTWRRMLPLGPMTLRWQSDPAAEGRRRGRRARWQEVPLSVSGPVTITRDVPRRGIGHLGAAQVRAADVFGLFCAVAPVSGGAPADTEIIGLPRIEALDAEALAALTGESGGAGMTAPSTGAGRVVSGRRTQEAAEPGVLPRPYVTGDDMRRIHWRASARTGRLMTREEEPPPGRTALIVLDDRRALDAAGGLSGDQREDLLVSAAASLWAALVGEHWEVQVRGADGELLVGASALGGGGGLGAAGGAGGRSADRQGRAGAGLRGEAGALRALAEVRFGSSGDEAAAIVGTQAGLLISVGPQEQPVCPQPVPGQGIGGRRVAVRLAAESAAGPDGGGSSAVTRRAGEPAQEAPAGAARGMAGASGGEAGAVPVVWNPAESLSDALAERARAAAGVLR